MFGSNPNLVPSVWIDARTGRPPDDGNPEPQVLAERLHHSDKRPVCETCIVAVNMRRAAMGLEQWPVLPGAYDPVDEDDPREWEV
jgi:hypothetical protein